MTKEELGLLKGIESRLDSALLQYTKAAGMMQQAAAVAEAAFREAEAADCMLTYLAIDAEHESKEPDAGEKAEEENDRD